MYCGTIGRLSSPHVKMSCDWRVTLWITRHPSTKCKPLVLSILVRSSGYLVSLSRAIFDLPHYSTAACVRRSLLVSHTRLLWSFAVWRPLPDGVSDLRVRRSGHGRSLQISRGAHRQAQPYQRQRERCRCHERLPVVQRLEFQVGSLGNDEAAKRGAEANTAINCLFGPLRLSVGSGSSGETDIQYIKASELFPKRPIWVEDSCPATTPPFPLLLGESVSFEGRTVEGTLFISNYRLYLLKSSNDRSGGVGGGGGGGGGGGDSSSATGAPIVKASETTYAKDINVPLGLIETIECKDIFYLNVCCKDARSFR